MTELWEPINGIYTATAPLFPLASKLHLLEAEWPSALVSAGFGAGVGAWMAGRIAERAKLRDILLAEIRSIDVAITICISIIDVGGSLKNQYVLKLLKEHESNRKRFAEHITSERRGSPFPLKIERQKLQKIEPPIAELQSLVFKNMNISPNGVKSMIALADAIANLNGIIDSYNKLLEDFKTGNLPPGFTAAHYHLSIPVEGTVNNEYDSAVRGIANYTNDVIFFAKKLAECLTPQGNRISQRYEKISGEKLKTRKIELLSGNGKLIPSDEEYVQWMKGWEIDPKNTIVRKKWWNLRRKIKL